MSAGAVIAYVGLGANVGDPLAQLRSAVQALARLSHTRLLACSACYASAPVGVREQPDFINAACMLETRLAAAELMDALLGIESAHGRVRAGEKGGPRTLDLDLLLYGGLQLDEPRVVVPHPRLHERAFVLAPLAELDASLVVPGRGRVTDLLAACAGQRLEQLDARLLTNC